MLGGKVQRKLYYRHVYFMRPSSCGQLTVNRICWGFSLHHLCIAKIIYESWSCISMLLLVVYFLWRNKTNPHMDFLFDPTKSGEIYIAESGISFSFFFLACHLLMDTKICYWTLRFASECLLSIPMHSSLVAC
jgi:hypothetical protein